MTPERYREVANAFYDKLEDPAIDLPGPEFWGFTRESLMKPSLEKGEMNENYVSFVNPRVVVCISTSRDPSEAAYYRCSLNYQFGGENFADKTPKFFKAFYIRFHGAHMSTFRVTKTHYYEIAVEEENNRKAKNQLGELGDLTEL